MEISKGEESRRLIIASIIFALILSMFLPAFLPPASATSGTVSDQSSCTSVGGFWSSGSCHVGNPSQYVLNAGDTLTIASGILFEIDGELHNFGTINNFGTLLDSGSNGGQLINENGGIISNSGALTSSGSPIVNNGAINNLAGGTINTFVSGSNTDNTGTITNSAGATITFGFAGFTLNRGTINNFGTIVNQASSSTSGAFSNNPGATINNFAGATFKNDLGAIFNQIVSSRVNNFGVVNNLGLFSTQQGTFLNICAGTTTGNFVFAKSAPCISVTNPPPQICHFTSVTFSATATGASSPYSFSWSKDGAPFATTATITDTPSVGTHTYLVTVTDSAGVSAAQVVSNGGLAGGKVTVHASPTLTATRQPTGQVFDGDTVTITSHVSGLTPPGDWVFNWQLDGSGFTGFVDSTGSTSFIDDTPALGSHTYTVSTIDARGCSASKNVIVNVISPLTISAPPDITAEATGPLTAVPSLGTPTVSNPSATVTNNAPAQFSVGSTTVTWTATDSSGHNAMATQKVTVTDTTPPSLSLPPITAEATGPSGASVSYAATASDVVDGTVLVTCSPASGSTFALGVASVNCSAADSNSNTAAGTLTVTVVDTTPPTLFLPAPITAEATDASGAAVSYTATSSDIVDGTVPLTCSPTPGTFALGTTTVSCSATDSNSNTAAGSFTITVQDTTPPSITMPPDIIAEATSPSGAEVGVFPTATDTVSPVTISCVPASGSTFALGSTPVTCTATDAASNSATGTLTVTVQDTTPPTIATNPDIFTSTTSPTGKVVTFSPPTSSDLVSGSLTPTCTPSSGFTFPIGTRTVICIATDAAGNSASSSFEVTVYQTTGFYQPIDMNGIYNKGKAGNTIPFKFNIYGGTGEITTISAFNQLRFTGTTCPSGSSNTDDIEVFATGGSSIKYDATAHQFVYNGATLKSQAGNCYVATLYINTPGGAIPTITALIQLTK